MRLRIDPEQAPSRHRAGRAESATDLGIALSGGMEFSGDDPRVAIGVTGTRMSVSAHKRLWPFFAAPKVRGWVEEHVQAGECRATGMATNAPMSTLKSSGPPIPDEGLAIRIVGHGAEVGPSKACRRFAMPTSTCALPDGPRSSTSAVETSKYRRGESFRSPMASSRCPILFPRGRLPRRVFAWMALFRRRLSFWQQSDCASFPARLWILQPAAARSALK